MHPAEPLENKTVDKLVELEQLSIVVLRNNVIHSSTV